MYKLIIPKIIVGEIANIDINMSIPMIVTSPGMVERECFERVCELYPEATVYAKVSPDPSMGDVLDCIEALNNNGMIIGLGGGSAMDVAKMVAWGQHLKKILIPTIAGSGSEVTHEAVIKMSGKKRAFVDDKLVADVVLFDTTIISTPFYSMVDAKAHAIEALGARNGSEITRQFAHTACKLLEEGDPMGSLLAGIAFGNSGTTLCHALSYPLSNRGIPHGEAVAAMLPYAIKFNGNSYDADIHKVDMDWDIEEMAREVMEDIRHLSNNPRGVTYEDVVSIYEEARN